MKTLRAASWLPVVFFAAAHLAYAAPSLEPIEPKQIPEPLKAWQSWALWNDEHHECPTPYSDATKHLCFWPSRLGLRMENAGGKFDLAVTVFHETWVPLPGSADLWPVEVKANGGLEPVVEHEGRPSVKLRGGPYRLEGVFQWKKIPQRIAVPPQIGLLALVLDNQPVEAPVWDASGFVWLKRDSAIEEADQDFLSVKLYAAVEDGRPLWLRTEVELTVAGKSREEDLGTILPEGWQLASVDSPLPVAIDAAGRARAQVRAGKWKVHADAFRLDRVNELHFAPGSKPAAAEELIAFRAKPEFRTVEVTGAPAVDVSQTTFPEPWRGLPVYRWETAAPLHLEERLRGMGDQRPAGLTIKRELWLDESGNALTFFDRLSGSQQKTWRLDAAEGQELGAVRSGGQGQLITRNPGNGAPGVEIRARDLHLEATGRLARTAALSATGWRSDADALTGTLNLPPGWRLFALFGADWVSGDWLTAWTLLDLFLLLVFTLAVSRLWGWGAALLAFVAFGLAYHEPGAPRYSWLSLLVPLALQRVAPAGWGRRLVLAGKWIALAAFLLVLVPFVAKQVQQAIYPQLEHTNGRADSDGDPIRETAEEAPAEAPLLMAVPGAEVANSEGGLTQRVQRKLDTIIIPHLEFREATVREALEFLRQKSVALDVTEPDPARKGINIVTRLDNGGPEASGNIPGLESLPGTKEARVTIALTNVPLGEALRYVTNLSGLQYKVEQYAVAVVPLSVSTETLVTKEWKVPREMLRDRAAERQGITQTMEARDFFTAAGITFPPGSSAIYLPENSRLIVKNTQENLDSIDVIVAGSVPAAAPTGAAPGLVPEPGLAPPPPTNEWSGKGNLSYDAKARIQTGPGVPEWKWREVTFGWNGPVSAAQQVRPWLISLTLERVLTALRVGLLLALAAVLLRNQRLTVRFFRRAPKAVATLVFFFISASAWAQSPFPDSTMLEKLRERLLEASDAFPTAADLPSATLTLSDRKITIEAEIHAALRVAVPLPGRLPAWSPLSVLVDDQPQAALRRDDGYLWVLLEPGVHRVHVEGLLANVADWQWTFLLKPHQVKIDAPDWTISGVKPSGVPEAQVFFARKQKAAAGAATYDRQEVEAIAEVDRTLELGLIWQVHTTVRRLSPLGRAVALRVPLLPGENVLTPAVIKEGMIEVRLGAQDQAFSWESGLAFTKSCKLATRAEDSWVEHWHLIASPVWNVALTGLPPVFEPGRTQLEPVWQPWPGESVELAISRPEALAGATLTVRRGTHTVSLGQRQRTSKLELTLGCSVAQDFLVTLPAEAEITGLTRSNAAIPVRKEAGRVIIPVQPGEQTVSLAWKTDAALGVSARVDEVRLPVESANLQTVLNVPEDRWVLGVSGPQQGPAVRFWGILICALLAALALGRVARSPLRSLEWMLLAIGLTQVPLIAALFVAGWLFAFAWRGSESFQQQARWSYNLVQLFLLLLTAVALGILVTAVGEGLLGQPEMFITGNGSWRATLRWSQARSEGMLPRPGCLSISIWWYRLAMLAWALWLAAALLRWLHRGWQAYGRGGFWRRKTKRRASPPPIPVVTPTVNP